MALTEGQRAFLFKVLGRSGTIEIRPGSTQWRIAPDFLDILEVKMQELGAFDGIRKSVELVCEKMTFEERQLVTSFTMEFAVTNFKNVQIPEVKDSDLRDTSELIDHLIDEEAREGK